MTEKYFLRRLWSRGERKESPEFSGLSEKAQRLVDILRDQAQGSQVAISYPELMKLTGWSKPTIIRYLKEARVQGLIDWDHQPNRPNSYRILGVKRGLLPRSYRRFLDPLSWKWLHKVSGEADTPTGYRDRSRRSTLTGPSLEDATKGYVGHDGAPPGREAEQREVERLASKGAHTLIVGWEGYGKTHFLRHLSHNGIANSAPCDMMIHLSTPAPPKEFLLNLGCELWKVGDLQGVKVKDDEDPYYDLDKLKVRRLHKVVRDSLAQSRNRYLILIDDIDEISPRQKTMIEEILELRNVQVIATARSQKPKISSLWHHFFPVELPRLPREVSDWLIEEFLEDHGIPVAEDSWRKTATLSGRDWQSSSKRKQGKGMELLKERLYRRSRGNPRQLLTLLRKIEVEGYVNRDYLQKELGAEQEPQYLDMTWVVIMTAAIVMAARYLGLGLHDRGLYILAGTGYAATLLIRWLSYRWRR